MTKRYAILQKKLEELELEINHAALSDEIEQKFVFMEHLLSAEVASCPTKPHHLDHIARRLTYLKASAFQSSAAAAAELLVDHVADASSSCSCTESCLNDDGEAAASDAEALSDFEDPEERSDCLEGEKAEMGFPGNDEAWEFYDCVVEEKEAEAEAEVAEVGRKTKKMKNEEREMVGVGKLCGAMASGVLIGMGLMVVAVLIEFSGYLQVEGNGNFVPPT